MQLKLIASSCLRHACYRQMKATCRHHKRMFDDDMLRLCLGSNALTAVLSAARSLKSVSVLDGGPHQCTGHFNTQQCAHANKVGNVVSLEVHLRCWAVILVHAAALWCRSASQPPARCLHSRTSRTTEGYDWRSSVCQTLQELDLPAAYNFDQLLASTYHLQPHKASVSKRWQPNVSLANTHYQDTSAAGRRLC